MENFTKKQIGLPDNKLENAIVTTYIDICHQADAMFILFERLFCDQSDTDLFFDFLNSQNSKEWLYSQYIDFYKISVQGLSIEKIVELDLIDVPRDDFNALLEQCKNLTKMIEKTKEYRFFFPLSKLFHQIDDDIKTFEISYENPGNIKTPEFDDALYNHIRKFTKNQEENNALGPIEKIIEGLNDLVTMGIIRNEKFLQRKDLEDLLESVVYSINSARPFSISPKLAFNKPFTRIFKYERFENVGTFGKPADVLKSLDPEAESIVFDEEQLEEKIFESE